MKTEERLVEELKRKYGRKAYNIMNYAIRKGL